VIILIPVVLSYHFRTSAILADFLLTLNSATPPRGDDNEFDRLVPAIEANAERNGPQQ